MLSAVTVVDSDACKWFIIDTWHHYVKAEREKPGKWAEVTNKHKLNSKISTEMFRLRL